MLSEFDHYLVENHGHKGCFIQDQWICQLQNHEAVNS